MEPLIPLSHTGYFPYGEIHGDNVTESPVEVLLDPPVVFYQRKENSLYVSCQHALRLEEAKIFTSSPGPTV